MFGEEATESRFRFRDGHSDSNAFFPSFTSLALQSPLASYTQYKCTLSPARVSFYLVS